MARVGYFSERQIDPIKKDVEVLQIKFQITFNPDVKAEVLEALKSPEPNAMPLEPKFYEIDVADEDVLKLRKIMEHYEIFELSDGHELDGEDYICPKCEFTQIFPGLCPKCSLELVTFHDFVNVKNSSDKIKLKSILIFLGGLALALYLYRMLQKIYLM